MDFKVWGVSSNTNSFGLYEVRLMNKQGHFYTVGASQYHVPNNRSVIDVPVVNGQPNFAAIHFEIPDRQTPDASQHIVNTVWAM